MAKDKSDMKVEIFDSIINEIEKGVLPWQMPWLILCDMNRITNIKYSGYNKLILSFCRKNYGFGNEWLTFNQARTMAGKIRFMESGTKSVQCYKFVPSNAENERKGFMKPFNVFNVDQMSDSFKDIYYKKYPKIETNAKNLDIIDCEVNQYLIDNNIEFKTGGERAYFSPERNSIQIPVVSSFKETSDYYGTLFHEIIHSTGKKLDRPLDGYHAQKESYSFEELIAEFGSAMLCSDYDIKISVSNTASYISYWKDSGMLTPEKMFEAYKEACRAVSYFHKSTKIEVEEDTE